MENIKENKSSLKKFIIRVFIVSFLLFLVTILDYFNVYSYDELKNYINKDINFTYLLDKFIGNKNNETNVETNGLVYITPCYEEDVISIKDGVVNKITYDNTYEVSVILENGTVIVYSNLKEVYLYIYDKVKEGEVIGKSNGYYEIK